ncbi:hypothetical protein PIB30_035794 [Stylosanthes scabra]|uniref:Uncharacterized protein n=1 Tax=Stylosanthes scabra TaxID=79078 RepID=A0ABU6VEF7_9FABA|nr:hypothetical protein [Stylosanthes scabra]
MDAEDRISCSSRTPAASPHIFESRHPGLQQTPEENRGKLQGKPGVSGKMLGGENRAASTSIEGVAGAGLGYTAEEFVGNNNNYLTTTTTTTAVAPPPPQRQRQKNAKRKKKKTRRQHKVRLRWREQGRKGGDHDEEKEEAMSKTDLAERGSSMEKPQPYGEGMSLAFEVKATLDILAAAYGRLVVVSFFFLCLQISFLVFAIMHDRKEEYDTWWRRKKRKKGQWIKVGIGFH